MEVLPIAYEIKNLSNNLVTWLGIDSIKNQALKEIAKKLQANQSVINGIIEITRLS